jgi:signal transduction histidine kinase
MRLAVAVAIAGLGVAVGVFSFAVARDDPGYWFAGSSTLASVALLAAGWALIGCGLAFWLRRPESRFGLLQAAAGFAWFLPEWNNPAIGSALAFTVGLCLYAACPPLVGHAVLAYPGGRLGSLVERGAVVSAYVGAIVVLGLLPALSLDPQTLAQGCTQCPDNLLLVTARGDLSADLTRVGLYLGIAWALALAALALWRLASAPLWARAVLAAGAVYLGLVAAWFAFSLERGELSNGAHERPLWLGQAGALVVLVAGVAWSWARARRARSAVARLVVDLAHSPPPGGFREVLARTLGDPNLVLAYPLDATGPLVDAHGRPVELDDRPKQTKLIRDGRVMAVLAHSPRLLDDEQLVDELAAAARLGLENERLQAELHARLEELRASRARIVEAGDAERKGLERDLHDGAQQRLVGLSLSLRLARSQLATGADPQSVALLDEADTELRMAIADLRDLAHGIFPTVLADEGLAAAVEALAEDGRVPIDVRSLAEGRSPPQAETAAYAVIAEALRATTTGLSVETKRSDDALVVDVETRDDLGLDPVALQDRVGALDGRLAVERREDGSVTLHAELPCGS